MENFEIKTFFDQYNDFANACGNPRGTILEQPDPAFAAMCIKLVEEEFLDETYSAYKSYMQSQSLESFVALTDGIVDTVYVLMQLARTFGIPFNEAWDEVHQSNMAKVVNGKVVRREDGKILKPEGWKPPALWDICYAKYTQRMVEEGKAGLGDSK